jgi:O-acetyl-ADP-ribose deacetylase (regulator of RNase III)
MPQSPAPIRRLSALLLSLVWLALPASAAVVVRPGPTALGASAIAGASAAAFAPQVPQWTNEFASFLATPNPDPAAVRQIARALATLDQDDPAVKARLEPLALALRAAVAPMLAKGVPVDATSDELVDSDTRYEVLNYPAVRALLTEEQQNGVGAASWAYNKGLWEQLGTDGWKRKKRTLDETIAAIEASLNRPAYDLTETPAPEAGAGPEVSVRVLKGDIAQAKTNAVMTTVQEKHLCHGGVNAAVGAANPCFFEQLQKAPELNDGEALLARGDGKGPIENVLFVKDRNEKPLADIVYEGLKAADKAGLQSIAVPAMRAGSVFGAVERSYREIVLEIRKGVERFVAGARTSLTDIAFVVHNDERLATTLQNVFASRTERERSLRTDLREAKLSGEGYTLTPGSADVADRTSPIYGSILEPWSLEHLLTPHKPAKIGAIEDRAAFSKPVTSVLNMPIKMPGSEIRVPKELEQFREFLQKIIDHEKAVNPRMDEFYMYLTVDQHAVKKGLTHRRPGVHIDGVQGARYAVKLPPEHLYSASDKLGTVFYDQPFDLTALDPAKQHVHAELERQADETRASAVPDFDIAFWDSYSVHRADLAKEDLFRTFIRVEFSMKQYDSEGDTHNPLFEYDWKPVARPIPAGLDDKPAAPAGFTSGYDAALNDLEPGQPHTVKDLGKWVSDNLGRFETNRRFFLAEGDSQEARRSLETEGWAIKEQVEKATGFHQVYDAKTPNGESVNLILGINGESRVIHLQSFLKLAGLAAGDVFTRRGFRSWKPEYKAAFEAAGHIPDLVVYGLTRPAMKALIGEAPELETFWNEFNGKNTENSNDISRRPMKIVELADGRKAWFFMPLFGELAGDLMEALLEHGARNVVVLSSAGSLDPKASLGDWFDPRDGGHLTMPTSNTQTQAWVSAMTARGIKTVDMEHAHIAAAFAAHPAARLTEAYVVSDVMTGPNRTDLTEVRIGRIAGLVERAREIIARALGAPIALPVRSAVNRSFPTASR